VAKDKAIKDSLRTYASLLKAVSDGSVFQLVICADHTFEQVTVRLLHVILLVQNNSTIIFSLLGMSWQKA